MKNVELNIDGMKCEGCVNRVKNILSTIKGVKSFDVSLENKKIYLVIKKDKVIDEVIEKIEKLDFKVSKS